jgi:DNA-binding PadR family transcriptional regulator
MALEHAILATLLSGPISGYGLAKRFKRSIGYFWQATHQQIYRELANIEKHGWAERVPSSSEATEKLYTLTETGKAFLAAWIRQPSEPAALREDLLVKVRAGSLVAREVLEAELRRRRGVHAEKVALYQALRERDFPEPQQLTYEQRLLYLPLLRGLMFEADNVAWCDAAIELLQGEGRPDTHGNE